MEEVFVPIKGYEGYYEISNFGRVKSMHNAYKRNKGFLQLCVMKIGYHIVSLCLNKVSKKTYVHRLVAEHFIDNPNGYKFVDHVDGNKLNNRVDNLRWCTKRQNETFRNSPNKKYSSKYIGVCYDKYWGKYKALIGINGKTHNIGVYKTEEEAYNAYKNFVLKNEQLSKELKHLIQ